MRRLFGGYVHNMLTAWESLFPVERDKKGGIKMKVKRLLPVIILVLFMTPHAYARGQNADDIARELVKRLFDPSYDVRILDHPGHELSLIIDSKKNRAFIYAMGHELFRMRARYVDFSTSKISIAKNWIEMAGNTREKMYLDIAKKILYFKRIGGKGVDVFARVNVKYNHNLDLLEVRWTRHYPIAIVVCLAQKKAWVTFANHLMFIMHAKRFKIKGSSAPIVRLKYKKSYKDGIYLNIDRKILYFRTGETGVFAPVEIKESMRSK